jgi:Leucine Rich repeat
MNPTPPGLSTSVRSMQATSTAHSDEAVTQSRPPQNAHAESIPKWSRFATQVSNGILKQNGPLSPEDIRDLADYLAASPGELHTLDLRQKTIGDAGLEVLSQALKVNNSLASLDLSSTEIDAAGAASLAKALEVNINLVSLNLSYNEINEAVLKSIDQALAGNQTLRNSQLASVGLNFASGREYPPELMPLIIKQMHALPNIPKNTLLTTIGGLADSIKPPKN